MGRRGLFGSVVLVGGSIVEVDIVLVDGRSGHGTRPGTDRRTAYHAASRGGGEIPWVEHTTTLDPFRTPEVR